MGRNSSLRPAADLPRPQLLAVVGQLQDGGRYQADGCSHTLLFKLYDNGRVMAQIEKETREGVKSYTDGIWRYRFAAMLWETDRDEEVKEWVKMMKVQDFDALNKFQLESLRERENAIRDLDAPRKRGSKKVY